MDKKNILVTGGGGFLGRNLINRLIAEGVGSLICLDQRQISFLPSSVKCVVGSFSDRGLMRKILPGVDVVVHLGSNALPANNDYVADVEQNLLGSIALIRECEEAKVKQIVFASSGGTIYGPNAIVPTPESAARNPICSYGIIKVAVESYLQLATRLTGMKTTTLRIANPYGPWQNWNSPQGVIAVFCHKIMRGEPIELFGDGSVARDFLYIDDLMDAFVLAIENVQESTSINIGSGAMYSMNEVISTLEDIVGRKAIVTRQSGRGCDVPCSCLAIEEATNALGWRPKITFATGIAKTFMWQRDNPNAF